MSDRTENEILRIARRNRWTLCYLAAVTTILLILMIMEAWNSHA